MKTIYRYELTQETIGYGPYNTPKDNYRICGIEKKLRDFLRLQRAIGKNHSNCQNHPSISTDVNCVWNYDILSACDSIKQLKSWFWGCNTDLIKLGFNLVEIKVKSTKPTKSKKQIGFVYRSVVSKTILK